MRAGRLRQRVELQNYTWTQNQNTGAISYTWVTVATLWASIEPLQGREFIAAQAIQSETTVRIRIRYRAGMKSFMRIVHDRMIYDITSIIDPQYRHKELQLMCKAQMMEEEDEEDW